MKKSLLALAVLGAYAGVAGAQTAAPTPSTVTLYGIMDAGVLRNDPRGGGNDPTWNLQSGNRNGSRFGLRGSEDIGGGNRVIFNVEAGFNLDTGTSAQGGRLFGRIAYVGLAGKWGELRMGRQKSAGYEFNDAIDPYGTGYGDSSVGSIFSAEDYARWDNVLEYRLPTVGGLEGQIGYSFNTGSSTTAGTEVPRAKNNQNGVMAGLRYTTGPLILAVTGEAVNCPDSVTAPATGGCTAASHPNFTEWTVGGTYDFGLLKLAAMYGQERGAPNYPLTYSGQTVANGLATIPNTPDSRNAMVGVTVPLAGGRVLGSVLYRQDRTSNRPTPLENNIRIYSVGYEYDLSKRTILYAIVADTDGRDALQHNTGFDRWQQTVGIRHLF